MATKLEELIQENASLRLENEQLHRMAFLPQLNPNPVTEFDRHGKVLYANPAARELLSRLGMTDISLFLPNDFSEMVNKRDAAAEKTYHREVTLGDLIFEESINISQDYDTARIYISDITRRKQIEDTLVENRRELKQTQDLLEAVTKGTEVIISAIDNHYCYTYFNQAYQVEFRRLTGKEIHIGMSVHEVFENLPGELKIVLEEWEKVLQGDSNRITLELGDPGVHRRVYRILHTPIRDAEGQVIGAGEVAQDISRQVQAEEALRESEGRFRLVLKNSPVTVSAQDKDLRYIWAYNQRNVDLADVIGKTDADLFPPETASWLTGLKRKVLEMGNEIREQGWVSSGGQQLFLDLYLEPIHDDAGQINGVGIATVDLTWMKLAQQGMQASKEQYRSLFEGMTEGFAVHEMIFDENGKPSDYRFLDLNPAFERITGLKRDSTIGKTCSELLPDECDRWVNTYSPVITSGESVQFEEYSPTLKKFFTIIAYRSAAGRFATIFMDITDHKQMEDELRINFAKYSVLFDSLPIGVTVSDQNGKILEANQEAGRLLGLSKEEQKRRQIDGQEWRIIRPDGTNMPSEEYASVRALKEQRRVENVEMGIVKGAGEITWISVTATPLPLDGYGVVIAYNDISQRMQAEDSLRKAHDKLEMTIQKRTKELLAANEELTTEINERNKIAAQLAVQTRAVAAERQRFNNVLEMLPAYLILLTSDYHVYFANRYFREHFGEDLGRPCYNYLFGCDEPCQNCESFKVLQTNAPHNWEWTGPDNRNYNVYDFPFTDVDGSTLVLEMGIDITDRKQAEERLRGMNAYNRSLIEASLDILATITPTGKIGDVNAATEAATGLAREELIGTDFHGYFTDPDRARAGYKQVFESGFVRDYELEIQHRDGHSTPVLYNASVYRDEAGEVAGVFAVARDMTERGKTRRQLTLLNTALEAAANGIIVTEVDGTILWSNPAFSQMTGYSYDEIIGQNPRLTKSGKQDPVFYQDLWDTICSGKVWHGELINRRKDGSYYNEEQMITPVLDQDGNIINFIAIKQDVTEHKLDEEALRKSEEQYRSLVIATAQIVWQTNANGEVVEDIPTWRAFTGQSLDEIQGQGWIDALHPDDRQQTAEIWAKAVETKTIYQTEYRIRHYSGEYYICAVRGVPLVDKDENISGWVGTCTDITEKRRYETHLIQAEKHAVVGRMVGSVTHEINNPLQTIKNCLYLIQQDTAISSPIQEPLMMALSETQRLSNLVAQLRQLYRPQTSLSMRPNELLEIIAEVHALIRQHLLNSNVSWNPSPGLKCCTISCVKEQIIEVLLNICMNAIEAMQPDGGILSVDMLVSEEKRQVGVIISDTGPGIQADFLKQIFEPFTTTKESGLGLGLSISYGIVHKHSGTIVVEDAPEHGARFTVWLPLAKSGQESGG